ncbi:TetR/AcrR family transcriptional regulator [Pseudogracilibacillus sp. SO30301A]|uniref:TetR/AcrR family transcriptional regulator n=1 Tax=Pseudogracilibacillus sp. SO30301A TaxID=3098291 RepID=UPI00300E1B9F
MNKERPKYKQIIDAAVIVIAENGYHASQVSKIAKQANVADGTIYLYFKNKEDILISVFKEKMGHFIEMIDNATSEQKSASDKLLTLINMHYKLLSESPHLAIVTQLELRQSKPELRKEINKVLKSYLTVMDEIIQQGIEENEIRKDMNPQIIRQMIFGTLDETVTTWLMKSQHYSLLDQAEEVHELLTKGFFK